MSEHTAKGANTQIAVLVVPADREAPITTIHVNGNHDEFCTLVEDYNTDAVFFPEVDGFAYVAASGKTLPSHTHNPRATQIIARFATGFAKRDRVEGPAVFVGANGPGDFADTPQEVLTFVTNLFGPIADA